MGLIIHDVYTLYSQLLKITENKTKKMFFRVAIEVVVLGVCYGGVCGRRAAGE
jgi:hypothetical protein